MKSLKIILEKHPDGYVAYPLGMKGIVVGQGDSYDDALKDVKSAIHAHVDAFGGHPEWKRMKGIAKYKGTVSKITKIFLVPLPYSQI